MILSAYQRARILLSTGIVVSILAFLGLSRLLSIPSEPAFRMSLLLQPSPLVDLVAVAVLFMVCVLIGCLIAGTVRFESGLFIAAGGLLALTLRGGTMRNLLQTTVNPSVYLYLAAELGLLFVMFLLAWMILGWLHQHGLLLDNPSHDGVDNEDHPLQTKLLACGVQIALTTILLLLLCQTEDKNQALAAVALAAYLGAIGAHQLLPVSPSIWFFSGPLIVGIAGYLMTFFNPEGFNLAEIRWSMGALARPLPLDYAAMGPAGAILGYWTSRRWLRARQADGPSEGVSGKSTTK